MGTPAEQTQRGRQNVVWGRNINEGRERSVEGRENRAEDLAVGSVWKCSPIRYSFLRGVLHNRKYAVLDSYVTACYHSYYTRRWFISTHATLFALTVRKELQVLLGLCTPFGEPLDNAIFEHSGRRRNSYQECCHSPLRIPNFWSFSSLSPSWTFRERREPNFISTLILVHRCHSERRQAQALVPHELRSFLFALQCIYRIYREECGNVSVFQRWCNCGKLSNWYHPQNVSEAQYLDVLVWFLFVNTYFVHGLRGGMHHHYTISSASRIYNERKGTTTIRCCVCHKNVSKHRRNRQDLNRNKTRMRSPTFHSTGPGWYTTCWWCMPQSMAHINLFSTPWTAQVRHTIRSRSAPPFSLKYSNAEPYPFHIILRVTMIKLAEISCLIQSSQFTRRTAHLKTSTIIFNRPHECTLSKRPVNCSLGGMCLVHG